MTRQPTQAAAARPPGPLDNREGWMMFRHSGPLRITTLTAEQVDIRDIAGPLGLINRFNGQSRKPVSVLAHSLLVAELCRENSSMVQLEALMHDAGEAYVGDWIRPLRATWGPALTVTRDRVQAVCFAAAGVPFPFRQDLVAAVAAADDLALRYEMARPEGYRRVATWHPPVTGGEWERAEAAASRLAGRGCALSDRAFAEREFLARAADLVPASAPLRRSVDEAVAELAAAPADLEARS